MHLAKYIGVGAAAAILAIMCGRLPAEGPTTASATRPAIEGGQKPVKAVRSDDALVQNFHAMGPVNGVPDIYRSGDPVREVEKTTGKPLEDRATVAEAEKVFAHLYARGIRTVIDFEKPSTAAGSPAKGETEARLELEKQSAEKAGITFIRHPMKNKGKGSFEDMTDQQTLEWLESVEADVFKAAQKGGVEFHCLGGRDRTGIFAAYLRMKYNHWTAEEAIQEMRNNGHDWTQFSRDGGKTSWHEDHLRAIAGMIGAATQPGQ